VAPEKYSGSCICGSVKYEISGEFKAFYHCHCGRCRKSTGTGHASNIILNPESAEWTEGEDLIASFKVPDAERFRTVFCKNCGGPLPRIAMERNIAVIPAGSLDSNPDVSPNCYIFGDSKAEWSCDAAELPTWAEYPPKP
jgi:hypothetical protein